MWSIFSRRSNKDPPHEIAGRGRADFQARCANFGVDFPGVKDREIRCIGKSAVARGTFRP